MVVHEGQQKPARFVKLTGGKVTLSGKAFYERYIVKQEQSALTFQLDDIKNGIYPVYLDIDLDFRRSTRTGSGRNTWRRPGGC